MDHGSHHDHSMMDHHGSMNHGAMGHANHGMPFGTEPETDMDMGNSSCMPMGHGMMMMAFHGGYCETILFSGWEISTVGGLIGSMIGIIIMAAVYEGIKYYREYLFWRAYNSQQYRSMRMPADKPTGDSAHENGPINVVGEVIHKQPPRMLSWSHGLQTVLHMVQLVMAYFLMLIFMTYNYWLGLAVMLGGGLGYFLFGWKKSVIVDVTEHCH